ncbi:MAG TPA: hypothetical protein VFW85_07495 [Gaiellaceae bacterium]|nr:hypothetical protein [Gaiellaceae bacterium]
MTGWNRAVATLVGAGVAGFLLWLAAQIGRGSTGGYWAAYGIVAGAGLVLALTQLRGRGGHPPGTFLLAFLPVLICAGWVLLAMQPHGDWFRNHVLSWSGDIGIRGVVTDIGTWVGVLAFGIGYVFGTVLEPSMVGRRERAMVPAAAPAPAATPRHEPAPATAVMHEPAAANEPTTAEREEVGDGEAATTTNRRPFMRTLTRR